MQGVNSHAKKLSERRIIPGAPASAKLHATDSREDSSKQG